MPLTRIALRAGKPAEYRKALTDSIQRALVGTFNVPKDDVFMLLSEHEAGNLIYDRQYLNIERSDDFVAIQLTVSNTRTLEQKKALYQRIADELAQSPGLRREDVFISLVEVDKENWSFGNGIAQYAV
ncbi:tautomerase family protein [Paraburkholderia sp. 22099]|jgi:phenylpyruvate tautomerase PptA (4-oxalocrotonate tautomerase family)|uniref:Phenylpyruvate tautomerase PptA (4-oxalocrotonate tautomerase family) n=1 Tax=Paraburkholderia terricola TaxID=169427 RepID=A0ABU1LX22_9BURK|nr:tautomerase family protein [Paraburkholderia terricola]MDR6411131.1 phenylpyruvate tautomerase PptA (4-oxalocrotonate tautomerase family) [Paraburkholderia terricola]MDR6446884.1 phenylpyruvate tautomerase PptA (4-oxalocrotonate tautomerase family) [Paraburkholderia terricola]MDR6483189.1 phenylpyruvate tautomerase PptA (4-oxalocrotonate tautomerase family) [Paraburkholderia terricola]MDR6492714.1 phenylpyruvate tautomerase PptA (4-oxalocrotonate tautomerase family) [Paraburkholderia terrico